MRIPLTSLETYASYLLMGQHHIDSINLVRSKFMPRLSFDCEELLNWWEPKTDTSFIFNFNWKSLRQLREAITIFLCSRLHNVSQKATVAITETGCPQLKRMLASNPSTPPDLLDFLSNVSPHDTLVRIAENPNTGRDTLSKLCFHHDAEVRAAVADNLNAPESCFKRLGSDESLDVRYRVAENPHAPAAVLYSLLRDENPYISHRARQTLSRLLTETLSPSPELNPNVLGSGATVNNHIQTELDAPGEIFAIDFKVPKSIV